MKPLISAIVPVRDEEHNVKEIFSSLKPITGMTEAIFVEGGSKDQTWVAAKKTNGKRNRYGVIFSAVQQVGEGKSAAVSKGFDIAKGKYLIIVDADMSIGQKDLEKVVRLFNKHGEKIVASGNRLKGFHKPKAFYWINYAGNYFFRIYYSLILRCKILDISCGTKAMSKKTWRKVRILRTKYGDLDPWGDVDWLYYGKRAGSEVKFININYTERKYGESKLQHIATRWKFALKMFLIGLKIIKFDITHE